MLDESMFEDIHEIAENSAYLKAIEEKDVSLEMLKQLPPFEDLKDIEDKLRTENRLTFESIFGEPTGFYLMKCFLLADYAVDKAIFIKDVEAYRGMRFESARRKVAQFIYERFVSPETSNDFKKGLSVFTLISQRKQQEEKIEKDKGISSSNNPSQISVAHQSTVAPEPNSVLQRPSSITLQPASQTLTPNSQLAGIAMENKLIEQSILSIGVGNNVIGVYGRAVRIVKERVGKGEAPKELFDDLAREVQADLRLDAFPRFLQSDFYKKYIRTKWIETTRVTVKDFTTFRVLGRGGFGAVHACRKKNSGTIYAMKCINKKLVKVKSALDNVMEERNVLVMLKSNFVTNLKYALQDEETLYLIMDLMLGGDLKFHLINAGRFTEKRARFYAAQVLLGLEHLHSQNIIYRDLKLENVLLDHNGHCRISDLGLAVISKTKIKGYAGTPGYTAPEMIKGKTYGASADVFSFGVMLYRMLCGSKPFKGKVDRDLDKAVIEKKPVFPKEIFTKEATALLNGVLQKKPEHRLGCGERGIQEIKDHPFFESLDWGLLEAGYIDPPFVPSKFDVNAASLKDIGDFDRAKYRNVKLDDKFKSRVKLFEYISIRALQDEMVTVLEKADENVNFEKFAPPREPPKQAPTVESSSCCIIC